MGRVELNFSHMFGSSDALICRPKLYFMDLNGAYDKNILSRLLVHPLSALRYVV